MTHRNDLICSDAAAVTPSDTAEVGFDGFYVGGAGDVAVKTAGGTTLTFKSCPVGLIIPIKIIRVMSANTTATNIVGFLP
jgi:hypothetical protein